MNRKILIISLVLFSALILAACAGPQGETGPPGPQGPAGPQGEPGPAGSAAEVMASDLSCAECHNDSALITDKKTAWSTSTHGSGTAYAYAGGRTSCTGCHSGASFSARIAAGLNPDEVEAVTGVTRQDCRACHQIHTTFTKDDFALETEDPVALFAFEDVTFDGGEGNLCANCHQPRRAYPEAVDGMVEVTSTHWGPHHGGESSMLLGIAGGGDVEGSPSTHYQMVEDTCVTCHMGEGRNHSYEPEVETCQGCHADAEDFDINGVQTEVKAMLAELEEGLIAKGWLDEEGHPTVTMIPEDEAAALWNWIYIAHEDKSWGVHNPAYTKALIEAGLEALK